jgi:predicted acylesterase/phospholipase RssA
LLSSGFLAFARHTGFLRAVDQARAEGSLEVEAIVGTSSGALVGALWAAGIRGEALSEALSTHPPYRYLTPRFWRGLFSLQPMIDYLSELLPPTFEGLERPLGVGVVSEEGEHALLTSGPLPEAVAASCAVPYLFQPVRVGEAEWRDGGLLDRVGWSAWRAWRPEREEGEALVHWVERSKGRDVALPPHAHVARSPRSHASLWSLGPFEEQAQESAQRTRELLQTALKSREGEILLA